MKNILYYLEPHIELNDSLFRFSSLKSILLPEIKALKQAHPDLNIKIIVSDIIAHELEDQKIEHDYVDLIIVPIEKLLSLNGQSYELSMMWQSGQYSHQTLNKYSTFYKKLIGKHFQPDLILSYESPAPFLNRAYPEAVLLNLMFGAFSRAPYPAMFTADPFGLFGNAFASKFKEQIQKATLSSQEKHVLTRFRREVTKSLSTYLPLKKQVDDIISKFDSVILFACQIDNYFAYNGCVDGQSQLSILENTLLKTPDNIGVVVTEHGYSRQISDDLVVKLKNKYPNFIYLEEKINGASQFLIPYLDGVVTVSSSLGYQAALWKKPLFVVGSSHLNVLAYSSHYATFCGKVLRQEQSSKDAELYYLLSHLNFSYRSEVFADGAKYFEILTRIASAYRLSEAGFDTFAHQKSPEEVEAMLIGDFRGWLLKQESEKYKDRISPDYLRISISECKAVSFDLFDTLAERDFAEPHELFLFIEPRVRKYLNNKNFMFHYFRKQAEADVRRPTHGEFEVTLDQIYEKFQEITGLGTEKVTQIKQMEIDAEIALVHPKRKMLKEYNFASLLVEKRSIITDIYHDRTVIETILKKIKVNRYASLWISAETKTRKHNGTLYPEYIDWIQTALKQKVPASRLLHVGDNRIADGDMAKKYGMKTYIFPKALDNFKESRLGKEFLLPAHKMGGISTSVMAGIFSNKFYSAVWNRKNTKSFYSADPYQYGFTTLGPLVLGFVQWLYHRAKLHNINHLYFLARDGWVLKKAYDDLYKDVKDAPKSYYLYCSRRAVMVPSILSEDCIYELVDQNFNARSIESLLDSRFGLSWNEIPSEITKQYGYKRNDIVSPYYEQPKLKKFLTAISETILAKAQTEREDYIDYLNSLNFIENAKNKDCAVVDIGYSGSMQMYLKKMLGLETLAGYYYLTHHHSRDVFRKDIFEGYLQNLDDHKIGFRHSLNDHVFIFESALSSPEGSLLSIRGKGKERKFIFLHAEEEERRQYLVNAIHRGSDDFIQHFVNRFGHYAYDYEISPLLSSALIFKFSSQPTGLDASMFVNFEVENLFGGGSVCLIAEPPAKVGLTNDLVNQLVDRSKWKFGARTYYNYLINPNAEQPQVVAKVTLKEGGQSQLVNVTRMNPPLTWTEKARAVVNLSEDHFNKKLAKLSRNPYQFFADAKNPNVQVFKELFDEQHEMGRFAKKVVRRMIGR